MSIHISGTFSILKHRITYMWYEDIDDAESQQDVKEDIRSGLSPKWLSFTYFWGMMRMWVESDIHDFFIEYLWTPIH